MADVAGLSIVATVLRADGRPVHVLELVDGAVAGDRLADELGARLAGLDAELASADPVAAALGRAERDFLSAELADLAGRGSEAVRLSAVDGGDGARRLVALRVRTAVERVEDALPALGRHLRRSVRTGTFCFYEPERPERWKVGQSP